MMASFRQASCVPVLNICCKRPAGHHLYSHFVNCDALLCGADFFGTDFTCCPEAMIHAMIHAT